MPWMVDFKSKRDLIKSLWRNQLPQLLLRFKVFILDHKVQGSIIQTILKLALEDLPTLLLQVLTKNKL